MPAWIVEQELYTSWLRRDRLSSNLYRGNDADDDPGQPCEYMVKGRVDPDDSYTILDDGSAVQDVEAWVGLDGLAYKPTWVQSVDLDTADALSITDAAQTGLDLAGPFTIECSVYFDSVPASGEVWRIAGKWEDGGDQQWMLSAFLGGDSKVGVSLGVDGYAQERGADPAGIVAGTWYHIAAVYDPDEVAATDKIKIYIDAVSSANFNSGSGGSLPDGDDDFIIGGSANGSGDGFKGRIQDVRIWNVVKSSTSLSNNRLVWQRVSEIANLVSWWPLNGDADDATDTGNDLSDAGTPTYVTGAPGLSPDGHIMVRTEFQDLKTGGYESWQYPEILMRLADFRQIVRNPSFERDNDEWTTLTGTPGFNANGAYGGRSFGGNGNGSGNTQENEQLADVAGLAMDGLSSCYTRTTYLRRKAAATTDTVQVKVRTYDSGMSLNNTYDSTATTPASDTSWERVVNMLATTQSTDFVKVTNKLVEISGGGGLEPNVYLDALDVRTGDIYDAFNGGPAAACLSNPNFNTNLTSWTTSGTWARVTTSLHEGAGNAQCSADGELYQVGTLPAGYDDHGDMIWLSCARRDSASTEKMNVRLEVLDSASTVLAGTESGSITVFTSGANPWKRLDLYLMIPSTIKLGGAGTAKVKLRFIGDVGAGADTRVDDIQCCVFKGRA